MSVNQLHFLIPIDEEQQTQKIISEIHTPLTLLFLNRYARNIHRDRTVHLHNHMSLDHIQHLHPPRNSGIRVQWKNRRSDICLQVWIEYQRIGHDFNGQIHSHGFPGLGFSRRPTHFSYDGAAVGDGGGGVSVPEGGEVRVLDGDVGGEGDVGAADEGGAVDEVELVDGDAVEVDDWVFDSEYGEGEDDGGGGGWNEGGAGDAAAALEVFAAAAAAEVGGHLVVVATEALGGRS